MLLHELRKPDMAAAIADRNTVITYVTEGQELIKTLESCRIQYQCCTKLTAGT